MTMSTDEVYLLNTDKVWSTTMVFLDESNAFARKLMYNLQQEVNLKSIIGTTTLRQIYLL